MDTEHLLPSEQNVKFLRSLKRSRASLLLSLGHRTDAYLMGDNHSYGQTVARGLRDAGTWWEGGVGT
ncbi:hypothetical protein E2C01_094022 [Portunus trituberculatus]|uniref:Uncharacterized protein n=1 Tax=Portunus trituberculatus TaxID=210409 RepID=A0A5B7K204_PORTR|nr:hypothetical protein [Portunus trituberculatus]